MRRLLSSWLIVALVALAAPAQASEGSARNVEFLTALLGGHVAPDASATMPDGRVVTAAQAIEEAAARVGSVDLASIVAGQGPAAPGKYFGDIWVISMGMGGCAPIVLAPSPVPTQEAHPQAWVYSGAVGEMSAQGIVVEVIAWTMKLSEVRFDAGWQISGQSDFFCIDFGGFHLALPFVDGIFSWQEGVALASDSDVHARNVAYLHAMTGDADLGQPATMPDGRVVPLGMALGEAAARAGSVDLAAIVAGAGEGSASYVGEVWLFDIGPGACASTMLVPTPIPTVPVHPQLVIHGGGFGQMSATADHLEIIDWTAKQSASHGPSTWTATGFIDFFCFDFGGFHVAFPLVTGVVTVQEAA